MKHNPVEMLAGALVLIAAAAFLFYAYSTAARDPAPRDAYRVHAAFDSIAGLPPAADVRLAGVKVGVVVSSTLAPETYLAHTTLAIDRAIRLPADTSAKIATHGLFGSTYITLTPGYEETLLQDGDEIIYTQGAVDIISLLAQSVFSADAAGQ